MSDVRDALRALRATPVISAVAVLSLALGIGANTAIFSILDSLMLRSLPVRDPQRLVLLKDGSWTNPIWEQIRDRQESAVRECLRLVGHAIQPVRERADRLRQRHLGERTVLRRARRPRRCSAARSRPADDVRGGGPDGPVAVISYDFWQTALRRRRRRRRAFARRSTGSPSRSSASRRPASSGRAWGARSTSRSPSAPSRSCAPAAARSTIGRGGG